jgi:hypothetical protein
MNRSASKRAHRRMDKGNMERRSYRHGNLVRMETPGKSGNFNNSSINIASNSHRSCGIIMRFDTENLFGVLFDSKIHKTGSKDNGR